MNSELQNSVALITSSDPNISRFGTGFVIRQSGNTFFLLTCDHVVRDVGGAEKVKADGLPATVIASGEEDGLDLAVLKVDGMWSKPTLNLRVSGEKGSPFVTAGFQLFGKDHLIRPLRGTLGDQVGLQSKLAGDRIQAWDLRIDDDYALQPGYSGSPVVDEANSDVLGVVSHRQGEGRSGLAISIEALNRIWKVIDSKQLHHNLLKLGYREQARLFRRLVTAHSVAAFLIHGFPDYGQRWLLNRLVVQYVPGLIRGKRIRVDLARKVRRNDVSALWRELGSHVGLRGRQYSPAEIAERVYQWWQTQNVLLIFHDVHCLPEDAFYELINKFWLPLATKARESPSKASDYKLLTFLVDYEGCAGSWNAPFAETIDSRWEPYTPIRAPRITEFSDNDLIDWIESEYDELPLELTKEMDEAVQAILENSDNGIPELALAEICDRCGCNWYEESEKWLTL